MSMKEHMIQALTNTPKFKEIRARLREAMFQILAQKDQYQTTNFFAKNFLATDEGALIGGIIKDYLECMNYQSTLAVASKEAGGFGKVLSREGIEKLLNKNFPEGVPILISLLSKDIPSQSQNRANFPSLSIPSFKAKSNLLDLLERPKESEDRKAQQESSNDENYDEDDIDFNDLLHVPEDESSEEFTNTKKRKKSF